MAGCLILGLGRLELRLLIFGCLTFGHIAGRIAISLTTSTKTQGQSISFLSNPPIGVGCGFVLPSQQPKNTRGVFTRGSAYGGQNSRKKSSMYKKSCPYTKNSAHARWCLRSFLAQKAREKALKKRGFFKEVQILPWYSAVVLDWRVCDRSFSPHGG